jgi:hypothetical protein
VRIRSFVPPPHNRARANCRWLGATIFHSLVALLLAVVFTATPQTAQPAAPPAAAVVEEALAAVSGAKNPTFVEFRPGEKAGDRVLVVGALYSNQSHTILTEELIEHFSSIYGVLERKGWLPVFSDIELVVPMPLTRVKAPLSLVKSLRDNTISRTAFAQQYQIQRLGG